MLLSGIPPKFTMPIAYDAGAGYITTPIPDTAATGRMSLQKGFPPETFVPEASGGNPPWGADANGAFYQITQWLQWLAAGGVPLVYDSAFSSANGGYPQFALLRSSTLGNGRYWISLVDNNTTDPDGGSPANWMAFPDLAIQLQRPNFAASDTGSVNSVAITLFPVPTSWAQIVGAPIRFPIAYTNTSATPTITINGLTAATMINSDGTALAVGQLVTPCIVEGIPRADGMFQVMSPSKQITNTSQFVTGCVYVWPTETAPAGTMECDGSTLLISSYPALYAILGTRYGGDGVSNFKIPDYRGYFWRIWDHGAGRDLGPRAAGPGGISGDNIGSVEASTAGNIAFSKVLATFYPIYDYTNPAFPQDTSLFNIPSGDEQLIPAVFYGSIGGTLLPYTKVKMDLNVNVGSGETRGINVNVMAIIATG